MSETPLATTWTLEFRAITRAKGRRTTAIKFGLLSNKSGLKGLLSYTRSLRSIVGLLFVLDTVHSAVRVLTHFISASTLRWESWTLTFGSVGLCMPDGRCSMYVLSSNFNNLAGQCSVTNYANLAILVCRWHISRNLFL